MDLFEAILKRRSVRAFTPKAVPDEVVDTIVGAARWAPSAGNCQARPFVVVKDPRVKKVLSKAALDQNFIEAATVTIVVCANDRRSARALHTLDLDACWVGAFDDSRVGEALNLHIWLKPVAIIPIGYPDEKPWTPLRLPIKDIIYIDRYGRKPI